MNYEPQGTAIVALDGWCGSTSSYERFQRLTKVDPGVVVLPFGVKKAPATRKLVGGMYTLNVYTLDGVPVTTVATVASNVVAKATFTLDASQLRGWYRLELVCPLPETAPSWFMFVTGGCAQVMPVCSGNYEVIHEGETPKWDVVPTVFDPPARPKPARTYTPFNTALAYTGLHREYLVPARTRTIHRPVGEPLCTFNYQAYHWSNLVRKEPWVTLLDGPRGVGSLAMATHLMPGRNGKTYFCDPWRFGRIEADGAITTLVGWRHTKPAAMYDTGGLELVGDWSQVPTKGMHECWGATWDQASLATDPNAPPIGGEEPHVTGPTLFLADTQNNRLLKAVFSPVDRSAPAVVTEFLTAADPWDVVCVGEVLYVSERALHRIAAYHKDTGQFLAVVAQGAPLATISDDRFVVRLAPLATIQAEDCVAPEGLAYQDGYLYFGSQAMGQVRKIELATGQVSVACTPTINNNTNFVKLALSDGTFGPRGTMFVSTWSNANFGCPQAFLPNGTQWVITKYTSAKALSQGKGGFWEPLGYASAVGCGEGRLFFGSSAEGIAVMSKALLTDPTPDYAKYVAGAQEFEDLGLHLTHGDRGFGYNQVPMPPVSENIQYYLGVNY